MVHYKKSMEAKFKSSTCPSHSQTLPALVRLLVLGVTLHWAYFYDTSLPHCILRSLWAKAVPHLCLLSFCHIA